MIHVLEALLDLWIAWLILIAHYVRKRVCRACNGQPAC